MNKGDDPTLVLGFPGYSAPARRLAEQAQMSYADVEVHRFPDGESLVRLPSALTPHTVFYCSLNDPNHKLVELELAAVTAFQLGAERLTLVAPYLCYMRQDRAFRPGEAVSQQIVGALIARHFDTLITVDPHLHRVHRLADAVPVRRAVTLSAAPLMADWLTGRPGRPLLLGPDAESRQWVSRIAERANLDFRVASKQRLADREVRIVLEEGAYRGRDVVLVDDVASTGRTLVEAAHRLSEAGAAGVSVLVTHALFIDDALIQLERAGVTDIHSSDSIPHPSNRLPLAPLLASALVNE